jgi:hypothetical protein
MITRRCVCGEEFDVRNNYKNYFLSGFDWFGHTDCLHKWILDKSPTIPVLEVAIPVHLTPPDVYELRLDMWFRSRIECECAVWLTEREIDWRYEEVALRIHGREYTPDFLLTKSQTFIELKGLWSGAGKQKLIAVREVGTNILLLPHYFKRLFERDNKR